MMTDVKFSKSRVTNLSSDHCVLNCFFAYYFVVLALIIYGAWGL